ncbi:hypothetical protein NMG60_11024652 [Bertholletia excelsa]
MRLQNMATITESLERSLKNCSLNQGRSGGYRSDVAGQGLGFSSSSDSPDIGHLSESDSSDVVLELNSQISLPYHWERCIDLKSGETYYINWRTGMKAKEDPRTMINLGGEYYSSPEDDDSSYDSDEGYSSESLPSSWGNQDCNLQSEGPKDNEVLVVGGCKRCLMYFMVPKQVEDCPKCSGQLLHFDRSSEN